MYRSISLFIFFFFFFNDTATTEIYTLSLHDALPILLAVHPTHITRRRRARGAVERHRQDRVRAPHLHHQAGGLSGARSEEHTSELQSRLHLVCRLLLEKKKKNTTKQRERHRNTDAWC